MQNKKNPKQGSVRKNKDTKEIIEVLKLLQGKIMASSALNGGFDNLFFKIEKIEEAQSQVGNKVDSIHEAIYHPDEGLFARVKGLEIIKEKIENVNNLEKEIIILQHQMNSDVKNNEKEAKIIEEQQKLIRSHENQILEFVEFKKKINSIAKWLLLTMMGGFTTLFGKVLYDFIMNHITMR